MVIFKDKTHSYSSESGSYISVTTLINKFKNVFDGGFWSMYKAYEQEHPDWDRLKKLYKYFLQKDTADIEFLMYMKAYSNREIRDNVKEAQKDFLRKWAKEKNKSLFKGTRYHLSRERTSLKSGFEKNPRTGGLAFVHSRELKSNADNYSIKKNLFDLEDGFYPELLLWNEDFMIAGQADRVFIETIGETRYVDLGDYKTSKKLDFQSFQHPTKGPSYMKPPVDSLEDCNVSHYTLQLSVYGWLLEQFGFKVRHLTIHHLNSMHKLEYKQKEVWEMIIA